MISAMDNEHNEHNMEDTDHEPTINQVNDHIDSVDGQGTYSKQDTTHNPTSNEDNNSDGDYSESTISQINEHSNHSSQANVYLLPRDNKGISIDTEIEASTISSIDDSTNMDNKHDYNFTWWPTGYNSEYIKSNTHTNTKLGDMKSAETAILAYIYGRDDDDNLFNQMDKRRNTLAEMMDKLHIGWRYTPKQRAYIEWYYITRGLPIEANPSIEVQREFDRYWLLSMNGLSHGPIKYMPINYTDIMDKIESYKPSTAMQREDYYCSWCIQHGRGSLRSIYCYEWDMSNQACINMHKNGIKSMRFTEYIRWYARKYMTSIDLFIQPTIAIMIAFEKYLQRSKYNSIDVYMPMRFKSLTIDDLSVLDDDNMVRIRIYKPKSRIHIWAISISMLLILIIYLTIFIPYMVRK